VPSWSRASSPSADGHHLVSGLIAYFAAVASMYLFLRRGLAARRIRPHLRPSMPPPATTLDAVGTPDLPTTTALAPALSPGPAAGPVASIAIPAVATGDVGLSLLSLILMVFLTAIHFDDSVLPMVAAVVLAYAMVRSRMAPHRAGRAALVAACGSRAPPSGPSGKRRDFAAILARFFPVPSFGPGALARKLLVLPSAGRHTLWPWTGECWYPGRAGSRAGPRAGRTGGAFMAGRPSSASP